VFVLNRKPEIFRIISQLFELFTVTIYLGISIYELKVDQNKCEAIWILLNV